MNAADAATARRASRWPLAQGLVLLSLLAMALAFLPLHDEAWWPAPPRPDRWWWATLLALAYAGFNLATWRRTRRVAAKAVADAAVDADADTLVVHASQAGFAQEIAERTAASLRAAGLQVRLRGIADVDAAALARASRLLLVASTTGEGDPPDPALRFVREVMGGDIALPGLRYAVLALGDRSYQRYCAFGHQLDHWLRGAGATPLFDLVEVDNGDSGALRHWQHHLGVIADAPELPDWAPARYDAWTLRERRELNPGSVGGAVFQLALLPPAGTDASWQAGDIAEVGPRQSPVAVAGLLQALSLDGDAPVQASGATLSLTALLSRCHLPDLADARGLGAQALAATLTPLPHREYSIASIPSEGSLQLLLRRMLRPDGSPGIGSGWLCDHARIGEGIDLRIRGNSNFHAPPASRPMILVGNGTGIAGLRAHLAARAAAGATRNWLLFGERGIDHDFFQREAIAAWLADGTLRRLDLAFSRDAGGAGHVAVPGAAGDAQGLHAGYVQDALRAQRARLLDWVDDGACVYLCGSLRGMAPGVDAVLREVLGATRVDAMLGDGRYRRDVY